MRHQVQRLRDRLTLEAVNRVDLVGDLPTRLDQRRVDRLELVARLGNLVEGNPKCAHDTSSGCCAPRAMGWGWSLQTEHYRRSIPPSGTPVISTAYPRQPTRRGCAY